MNSAFRAGLVLVPLLSIAAPGQADVIIYRFSDVTDVVQFQVLVNGGLTFTDTQGGESYSATIPLIAPLAAPLSLAANIFEPGRGSISDVFSAQGAAGGASIAAFFVSHTDGGPVLDPLPGAISLVENGDIQTVGSAILKDGSTVTFQFQSDVAEVSEPPLVLPMLALFIAVLGRRRSRSYWPGGSRLKYGAYRTSLLEPIHCWSRSLENECSTRVGR